MKRDALTLLGCSGSLVLTLLAANPAKANTPPLRELVFEASTANNVQEAKISLTEDKVGCGCNQENSKYTALDAALDTVGDLAVENLGCDCAGCRNTVVRMVQTGQLTFPQ